MDAAHKQQIKDALLAQAQAELAAMRQRLDSEHAAAEADEEDVSRVDDVSQQDYAGDGAVVAFAGGRYVVGVRRRRVRSRWANLRGHRRGRPRARGDPGQEGR